MVRSQRSVLRAYGYTDEQIAAMSRKQREAEYEEAIESGVSPFVKDYASSATPPKEAKRKEWPLWPFILSGLVAVGFLYWLNNKPMTQAERPVAVRKEIPGWKALIDCMSVRSFDGLREITLFSSQVAKMTVYSLNERKRYCGWDLILR
jgi:hypothetical protein